MSVFLSDRFTVHEYVVLLPNQITEGLQVYALVPHAGREDFGHFPEGGEFVECLEVWRVEEVERGKFLLFIHRLKFFLQNLRNVIELTWRII